MKRKYRFTSFCKLFIFKVF